jgi:cbb3-type cytochrome oxidase subunit 3
MLRQNLESIAGVSIYPIISLLIFFLFFVALITYVVRTKKQYFDQMSGLPLQKNESNNE